MNKQAPFAYWVLKYVGDSKWTKVLSAQSYDMAMVACEYYRKRDPRGRYKIEFR